MKPDLKQMPSRRIRFQRWARIGCLPEVLIASIIGILLALLLAVGNRTSIYAPPALRDIVESFLSGSIVFVVAIQIGAVWVLGLQAAHYGSQTVAGGTASFKPRIAVMWQRMRIPLLSVISARLIILGLFSTLVIATISARLPVGYWILGDYLLYRAVARSAPLLIMLLLLFGIVHAFVGPWLRLWYSLHLGAFAATNTQFRHEQASLAATARVLSGLLVALAFIWGLPIFGSVFVLFIEPTLQLNQPSGTPIADVFRQLFDWRNLSPYTQALYVMVAIVVLIPIHTAGQLILSTVLRFLTLRRLSSS